MADHAPTTGQRNALLRRALVALECKRCSPYGRPGEIFRNGEWDECPDCHGDEGALVKELRASLALARTLPPLTDPASAKHTGGGWSRNIPPARKYPIIFAGRNKHVCRLITDGMTDEEAEANANLIAAAPDMLEALHGSVRLLRAAGYAMDGTITQGIQAAIWKATGGGIQG